MHKLWSSCTGFHIGFYSASRYFVPPDISTVSSGPESSTPLAPSIGLRQVSKAESLLPLGPNAVQRSRLEHPPRPSIQRSKIAQQIILFFLVQEHSTCRVELPSPAKTTLSCAVRGRTKPSSSLPELTLARELSLPCA